MIALGESISADEILRQRFEDVGRNPEAFSSIKYVGTKTNHNCPTDFQELHKAVVELANDNSVRSRRSLAVVYNVLCVRTYVAIMITNLFSFQILTQ